MHTACRLRLTHMPSTTDGQLMLHAGMCSTSASTTPIADTVLGALQRAGLEVECIGSCSFRVAIPDEDLHFLAAMHGGLLWEEDEGDEQEAGEGTDVEEQEEQEEEGAAAEQGGLQGEQDMDDGASSCEAAAAA